MPRYYKRKKESTVDEKAMEAALKKVSSGVLSVRKAADMYGLNFTTLQYRKKKLDSNYDGEHRPVSLKYDGARNKHSSRQVFDDEEEKTLVEYALKASKFLSVGCI